jgi:hypothetical protein
MEIKQVVCLKTQNLGVYSTGCARNLHWGQLMNYSTLRAMK